MAKQDQVPTTNPWAACISAAACGAWSALLVGFVVVVVTGVAYIILVHTPLVEAVGMLWGVGPRAVTVTMLVFTGTLKFVLILWLLGCVCLSVWARRLRSMQEE